MYFLMHMCTYKNTNMHMSLETGSTWEDGAAAAQLILKSSKRAPLSSAVKAAP